GDARDASGPAHGLPFAHVLPLAEERDADVVFLEVERDPDDVVLELEHLRRDGVLEPVDAGDAVADLQDGSDLRKVGLDVVLLDPRPEDLSDLFGAKLHRPLGERWLPPPPPPPPPPLSPRSFCARPLRHRLPPPPTTPVA